MLGFVFATVVPLPGRRGASSTTCTAAAAADAAASAPRPAARAHLSVLLGVFVLLKAVAYWLDRYGLVITATGSRLHRPGYTDVNAVLPAKNILAVDRADLRAAVLRQRRPAHLAAARCSASACWSCRPCSSAASTRRSCSSSRSARTSTTKESAVHQAQHRRDPHGVRHRRHPRCSEYQAHVDADGGSSSRPTASTVANIRLLDPPSSRRPSSSCSRSWLTTASRPAGRRPLHRSTAPSATPSSRCASSTYSGLPAASSNWINDHTVYTHGFGFVARLRQRRPTADGKPNFFVRATSRRPGALGRSRSRGSTSARSRRRTRIVGGPQGRTRRSSTTPTTRARRASEQHLHRQGRRADRLARSTGCCSR